jgi:hypothetical protein
MATRAAGDPDFGSPAPVPVNNHNAPNLANMGDLTLSRDERLIVFGAFSVWHGAGGECRPVSTRRDGKFHIFHAQVAK